MGFVGGNKLPDISSAGPVLMPLCPWRAVCHQLRGLGGSFPSEKWGRQIGQFLLPFLTTKRKLWEIRREIIIQTEPGFLALFCVIWGKCSSYPPVYPFVKCRIWLNFDPLQIFSGLEVQLRTGGLLR